MQPPGGQKDRVKNPSILSVLFRYILPLASGKIPHARQRGSPQGGLESLLSPAPEEKKESSSSQRTLPPHATRSDAEEIRQSIEEVLSSSKRIEREASSRSQEEFAYSFAQSRSQSAHKYSVFLEYSSTDDEETLTVTVRELSFSSKKKKNTQSYSFSVRREKPPEERDGREIHLSYASTGREERAALFYRRERRYLEKLSESREDFTPRVPLKTMHLEPKSSMGGILGYTYLGENFMVRRDDLTGWMARMVDIHECIHTPDEYETRILTDWIMRKPELKYRK